MAGGTHFYAKIEHDAKTIEKLYHARYFCYDRIRVYLRMAIGLMVILGAILAYLPMWGKALLLLAGTWLLVSGDFPAQIQADRVLQARHGNVPGMQYEFFSDNMKVTENGAAKTIGYKKITRLVTDYEYFYLFLSKDSCCMVDRKTIKPGTDEELAKLLQEKSGAEWRQEKQLLALNFYDIRNMIRDRKRK